MRRNWDIFCRVIDNYGDIGICWRLARQLAGEHGQQVRLWLDDLASLTPLQPEVTASADRQSVAGVEIRRWDENFPAVAAADVVIEAFACVLPASYEQAMAARPQAPLWLNLEYLSAEDWVAGCHGLASPHPGLPLVKYFWFPGFSAGTGGLLRERDLIARREVFQRALLPSPALQVSLFCYEYAPVAALLDAWATGTRDIHCRVAAGKPQAAVHACLGEAVDGRWQQGRLTLEALPFLPQQEFDPLLWRSDLNFVRGEDSFVRAQWAARPLIWQIYRQEEAVHLEKLQAFLGAYEQGLAPAAASAWCAFHRCWNAENTAAEELGCAWRALESHLPELGRHARRWCDCLLAGVPVQAPDPQEETAAPAVVSSSRENAADLATNLVNFADAKL